MHNRKMALLRACLTIAALLASPSHAGLVINELYVSGGSSGSQIPDYVELLNTSATPISLAGYSVQYSAAAGATWQVTALPVNVLPAGAHFLIREAGAGSLPLPDATGTLSFSNTAGKLALVSSPVALSGSCGSGVSVVDFVGYGSSNCSETNPAMWAGQNPTLSLQRFPEGADTNNNLADFHMESLTPMNLSASPIPSIPEPSSWLLVSCGLMATVLLIRRRAAASQVLLGR